MNKELEAINRKLDWLRHAHQVDSLTLNWLMQVVCATGDKAQLKQLAQIVSDMALNSDMHTAAIHEFQELISLNLP